MIQIGIVALLALLGGTVCSLGYNIHKNRYRFIDEKGDEIKDQKIIKRKIKEIEQFPLLEERPGRMSLC